MAAIHRNISKTGVEKTALFRSLNVVGGTRNVIEYENVTKIFGSGEDAVTAVNNVNLKIEQGNLVTFLGPSGCGKTTLLRLTNRLLSITQGTISVNGKDIMSRDPVKLRQTMGYAIQQVGLFPNKTIRGNIATVPKLLGWESDRIDERVDELLDMLRLEPSKFRDRFPVELSGGQQQRIGVARCLAADPEILLMDEPFGAIDPINREVIQNEFLRIQGKLKKTIAFVTHDIHEAIKMGDKIAIFQDGELVQYNTPELILTRPKNKYIADFVGADRALKVLGIIRVHEAMNNQPENVVKSDDQTEDTLKFLDEREFTHCVVLDGDKPIGYVTPKILKYENTETGDVAEQYPVLLERQSTLRDAMSHMLMFDMRVLCVIDENGDFAGNISMDDIQRHLIEIYAEEGREEATKQSRKKSGSKKKKDEEEKAVEAAEE